LRIDRTEDVREKAIQFSQVKTPPRVYNFGDIDLTLFISEFQEDYMGHGIIWWIIVGLIAGWAAGKIMKGGGYGVVADIILGILGAIIGGWVVGLLGLGGGGMIWSILVAILGAVILIWLTRLFKRA
jgi:uncharacterized membrane protein YeaQ/YmgE (transglycosylase-associated protein family)